MSPSSLLGVQRASMACPVVTMTGTDAKSPASTTWYRVTQAPIDRPNSAPARRSTLASSRPQIGGTFAQPPSDFKAQACSSKP